MFMPLVVNCTSLRDSGIDARGASAPSTKSCRESAPCGTEAIQMFWPESCTVQPETWLPPDRTGVWPEAACQVTVWPFGAESALVNASGAESR